LAKLGWEHGSNVNIEGLSILRVQNQANCRSKRLSSLNWRSTWGPQKGWDWMCQLRFLLALTLFSNKPVRFRIWHS
jgi:hypothetical protein